MFAVGKVAHRSVVLGSRGLAVVHIHICVHIAVCIGVHIHIHICGIIVGESERNGRESEDRKGGGGSYGPHGDVVVMCNKKCRAST
jgi:hypothetical protein